MSNESLPLPGAWIEILVKITHYSTPASRSLYRERGLKSNISSEQSEKTSRSLYRERGLKFSCKSANIISNVSLPLPGAWIEM